MSALILLLSLTASVQSLRQPDGSWPVTVKYDDDGCNTLAGATEVFIRPPMGCNPTPTGTVDNDKSWYATCSAPGTEWSISWFTGLTCSVPDFNQTRTVPELCETNDKNEQESAFCYSNLPTDQNPLGSASSDFEIVFALTASSDCNMDTLVMYQFFKSDKCIKRPDNTSQMYSTDGATGTITSYNTPNCTGSPTEAVGKIGDCFVGGPNIYAKIVSLTSGIPTDTTTAVTTRTTAPDSPVTLLTWTGDTSCTGGPSTDEVYSSTTCRQLDGNSYSVRRKDEFEPCSNSTFYTFTTYLGATNCEGGIVIPFDVRAGSCLSTGTDSIRIECNSAATTHVVWMVVLALLCITFL